eukprot:SM000201S05936  [mRNA]  locus=s201:253816:258573:- [translate_table: standard]
MVTADAARPRCRAAARSCGSAAPLSRSLAAERPAGLRGAAAVSVRRDWPHALTSYPALGFINSGPGLLPIDAALCDALTAGQRARLPAAATAAACFSGSGGCSNAAVTCRTVDKRYPGVGNMEDSVAAGALRLDVRLVQQPLQLPAASFEDLAAAVAARERERQAAGVTFGDAASEANVKSDGSGGEGREPHQRQCEPLLLRPRKREAAGPPGTPNGSCGGSNDGGAERKVRRKYQLIRHTAAEMKQAAALIMYATLLMPGFLQVMWYYFLSPRVVRSIIYRDMPRNRLDLYLPAMEGGGKPVVIFVTGGAWTIGYKAWGALLGQCLEERGIVVASLDYRNFPQGLVTDMIDDVSAGVQWVLGNIHCYGGDADRVVLVGQSAGAHLSALALVLQAVQEAGTACEPKANDGSSAGADKSLWPASRIQHFIGVSGGYNLMSLVDHLHDRGLHRRFFFSIMGGKEALPTYSPTVVVKSPAFRRAAAALMPPVTLFHGTADYSIPMSNSVEFAERLKDAGVETTFKQVPDKTHTDLILQDPMRGGKDELLDDILAIVHKGDKKAIAEIESAAPRKRLVPELLIRAARRISPF